MKHLLRFWDYYTHTHRHTHTDRKVPLNIMGDVCRYMKRFLCGEDIGGTHTRLWRVLEEVSNVNFSHPTLYFLLFFSVTEITPPKAPLKVSSRNDSAFPNLR